VKVLDPVREDNNDIYIQDNRVDTVTFATVPWYMETSKAQIARGRWFTEVEYRGAAPVAIIGHGLAKSLFEYRDPLFTSIRIGSKIYTVIGILKATVTSEEREGVVKDRAAYVPMSSVRERFGETNVKRSSGSVEMEQVDLHQILVEVDTMDNVMGTAAALQSMLSRFHRKSDFELDVPLKLLEDAKEEAEKSKRLFGSIAAISLLVGGIGIMNIMLATVTERTREIGVRRALGAHRKDITTQFLVETMLLSVLGGLVGIGGGLLAATLHNRFVPDDPAPIVVPASVLLAFGISALVGVLAGLYPAMRAAHMDPIKALRHE
jgi:putative ABC transport system permease protein